LVVTEIMQSAYEQAQGGLKLYNTTALIGASATIPLSPFAVDRAGTVTGATLIVNTAAAAGESAALQFRKNGSNIVGATFTYDSTKAAATLLTLANVLNVTVVPGDVLDYVITYVAGGGPALSGTAGNHVVALEIV
jgi:hypothetical protein